MSRLEVTPSVLSLIRNNQSQDLYEAAPYLFFACMDALDLLSTSYPADNELCKKLHKALTRAIGNHNDK